MLSGWHHLFHNGKCPDNVSSKVALFLLHSEARHDVVRLSSQVCSLGEEPYTVFAVQGCKQKSIVMALRPAALSSQSKCTYALTNHLQHVDLRDYAFLLLNDISFFQKHPFQLMFEAIFQPKQKGRVQMTYSRCKDAIDTCYVELVRLASAAAGLRTGFITLILSGIRVLVSSRTRFMSYDSWTTAKMLWKG